MRLSQRSTHHPYRASRDCGIVAAKPCSAPIYSIIVGRLEA